MPLVIWNVFIARIFILTFLCFTNLYHCRFVEKNEHHTKCLNSQVYAWSKRAQVCNAQTDVFNNLWLRQPMCRRYVTHGGENLKLDVWAQQTSNAGSTPSSVSSARDSWHRISSPNLHLLGAAERGAIYPTQFRAILVPQKNCVPVNCRYQTWYFWKDLD